MYRVMENMYSHEGSAFADQSGEDIADLNAAKAAADARMKAGQRFAYVEECETGKRVYDAPRVPMSRFVVEFSNGTEVEVVARDREHAASKARATRGNGRRKIARIQKRVNGAGVSSAD